MGARERLTRRAFCAFANGRVSADNGIGNEGAVALASALSQLSQLQFLDLSSTFLLRCDRRTSFTMR